MLEERRGGSRRNKEEEDSDKEKFSLLRFLFCFCKINLKNVLLKVKNLSTFVRKRDFSNNRNFSIETKSFRTVLPSHFIVVVFLSKLLTDVS